MNNQKKYAKIMMFVIVVVTFVGLIVLSAFFIADKLSIKPGI